MSLAPYHVNQRGRNPESCELSRIGQGESPGLRICSLEHIQITGRIAAVICECGERRFSGLVNDVHVLLSRAYAAMADVSVWASGAFFKQLRRSGVLPYPIDDVV